MATFDINPVLATELPEVARFLHKQDASQSLDWPMPKPVGDDARAIESRLRWLLLDNPLAARSSRHGFCIRDGSGTMAGLVLCFPNAFVAGDQRLFGLCAGGFFVEPQARSMGFYLFRKYLGTKAYSLHFSSTCNGNSAPLWKAMGGHAIPNFDLEYILPLRLHTLLPALLAEKTSARVALAGAQLIGRCGNPVMNWYQQRPARLKLERCQDWEKLSAIFHRCRSKDSITTDRSPKYLEWRYGQSSDPQPSGVYLFRDTRGNEGWFSLGAANRGRWRQIPSSVLLDAIWPRETIVFGQILPLIVRLAAGQSDLLCLRPRLGFEHDGLSRWAIRRRWHAPSGFVIARERDSRSTAAALDLCWADGDGVLPVSPILRPETEMCSGAEN